MRGNGDALASSAYLLGGVQEEALEGGGVYERDLGGRRDWVLQTAINSLLADYFSGNARLYSNFLTFPPSAFTYLLTYRYLLVPRARYTSEL